VGDILAAGGSLRVPRRGWQASDGIDYQNRARLAERHGKVPAGKRLSVCAVGSELEIRLVDDPGYPGSRAELVPVPVPVKVGRYHPAARQFRERSDRHEVSRVLLPRTTRIIHAVAVEVARRRWSAQAPVESETHRGRTGWTGAKDGHLTIAADGYTFWLRLREDGVHTRGQWEHEVKHYRNVLRDSYFYRDRELPSGPYDAHASGQLKLELLGGHGWLHRGRQSHWADRQSWTLEERLPHLLREIEERIAEAGRAAEEERAAAEQAATAARRNAEQRKWEWQRLMEQAKERLVEEHRATQLRNQADRWQEASRLGGYCDAMEAAYGEHPLAAEWLAWARGYVARLDPLIEPPGRPAPPDATPDALQQHLPVGWSAHGPEHTRRIAQSGVGRPDPRGRGIA
jgi:hypothetical protein